MLQGALGDLEVGQRVKVTQQIVFGRHTMTTTTEGVIKRFGRQKTGSWFAHAKDDKLWLDRLELERADGEIIVCNLDDYTAIEVLTS